MLLNLEMGLLSVPRGREETSRSRHRLRLATPGFRLRRVARVRESAGGTKRAPRALCSLRGEMSLFVHTPAARSGSGSGQCREQDRN